MRLTACIRPVRAMDLTIASAAAGPLALRCLRSFRPRSSRQGGVFTLRAPEPWAGEGDRFGVGDRRGGRGGVRGRLGVD